VRPGGQAPAATTAAACLGSVLTASIDRAVIGAASPFSLAHAAARERFVAQVAHDLRGPLSAIHSGATLLVRRPDAPGVPRWAVRMLGQVERTGPGSGSCGRSRTSSRTR
jgi:signal transduction histidine kinase